jgi:hypothetical protein
MLSFFFWLPWQQEFYMKFKFFEQFSKVTFKGLSLWSLDKNDLPIYEEMSYKVNVNGRRTDGRRTKSDHKSSPFYFATGELKMNV